MLDARRAEAGVNTHLRMTHGFALPSGTAAKADAIELQYNQIVRERFAISP